jgi:periplasmic protein TonB
MKQKIKIMKHKPELSDEEIRSYMDFDRLVADRNLVGNTAKYHLLKWMIPLIAVVGTATWITFYSINNKEQNTARVEEQRKEQSMAPAEIVPPAEKESENVASEQAQKLSEKTVVTPSSVETKKSSPQVSELKQAEDIYIQAEPVEGYSTLYAYFNSQLVYPMESIKDSIQGVETISFIINAEGRPEKIMVKQSLGAPFEKEARRLIENMPLWKPATLNGKPVPSQMSLPLTFQIQKVNVSK